MENIVRKGEIACNKQFVLFLQCLLPYMALIFHFECTLKCRLQFVSIWTCLKFFLLVMGLGHLSGSKFNLRVTFFKILTLKPNFAPLLNGSYRAFIFHMLLLCCKTFSLVPESRLSV